jgi:hypothetical protein
MRGTWRREMGKTKGHMVGEMGRSIALGAEGRRQRADGRNPDQQNRKPMTHEI